MVAVKVNLFCTPSLSAPIHFLHLSCFFHLFAIFTPPASPLRLSSVILVSATMSLLIPTDEDKEELLLSCRYGELDEVQQFVAKFSSDTLNDIRDHNGNTALHMVCGNGHTDILEYLLTVINPSLLSAQNNAQSTALHWAAVNSHLSTVQKLVQYPKGPGVDLIDVKNTAGRSPLGEAENIGWDEGAKWMVEMMNLDDASKGTQEEDVVADAAPEDIEVEIQDADGQIARMKIGQGQPPPPPPSS